MSLTLSDLLRDLSMMVERGVEVRYAREGDLVRCTACFQPDRNSPVLFWTSTAEVFTDATRLTRIKWQEWHSAKEGEPS